MNQKLIWVWVGLALFNLLYFFGTYAQLPALVATHFDALGNPNGFQSKDGFIASFLPIIVLTNGLFAALYFFSDKIPPERMNLPNKAKWLSNPENLPHLYAKLRLSVVFIALFVNSTLLFGEQVIFQQNVPGSGFHISIFGGVVVILAVSLFMILWMISFFRPPDSKN